MGVFRAPSSFTSRRVTPVVTPSPRGKDAACKKVAGGGPFGRQALLGLGEKDRDECPPPQAVPQQLEIAEILEGTEEVKGEGEGETDQFGFKGLPPGKPFLVGFSCRTVVAM